jgi:hypothetical protein
MRLNFIFSAFFMRCSSYLLLILKCKFSKIKRQMFTGIIETLGIIKDLQKEEENIHITISSSITNELKIDQTFVNEITSNPKVSSLMRSTIELGHSLHMTVVAEGVETVAQRDLLAAAGDDPIKRRERAGSPAAEAGAQHDRDDKEQKGTACP